jgi:hypothetical protein
VWSLLTVTMVLPVGERNAGLKPHGLRRCQSCRKATS